MNIYTICSVVSVISILSVFIYIMLKISYIAINVGVIRLEVDALMDRVSSMRKEQDGIKSRITEIVVLMDNKNKVIQNKRICVHCGYDLGKDWLVCPQCMGLLRNNNLDI